MGQTCSNALDGDRLGALVGGRKRLLGRVKRHDVEEGVDEHGLSEARFAEGRSAKGGLGRGEKRTDNHGSELEALADALPVDLVWKVCETDVAHELLANDGGQAGRVLLDGGAGVIGEGVGGGREKESMREEIYESGMLRKTTAATGLLVKRSGTSVHRVRTRYSLDLPEHTRVSGDTHAEKLLGSPVFVKNIICVFPQFHCL